jgi:hypothetical protein
MAGFMVGTEGLRAAAHQCKLSAGQLAIAAECHREASMLEVAEHSLLRSLASSHEAFAEMLQRRLEKSSTVLTNSAHVLAEAARKYDAGNAEATRVIEPEATS